MIRSEEERVQELQDKIAAIRARGQKKKARANPVTRLATQAVKSIDKAARETDDAVARKALGDAREPLSAWLSLQGLTVSTAATQPPEKAGKKGRRKNNTAMSGAN